ncbi:MAG: hypothetical protein ACREK6_14810 [Candidatus Rokuibacteriota bacterium]
MRTTIIAIVALILAACARPAPPTPAVVQPVTGEVWGWNEGAQLVTLRQGGNLVHVKVTPDQFAGLRLHQVVTLRGELITADVERTILPHGRLEARGAPASAETTGKVARVDPSGTVAIDSAQGPVTVWIGTPGAQPFQPGEPVRVRLQVQPLELLPPDSGDVSPSAMVGPPAPSASEPGEYAVVRGRVTSVEPAGRLSVESSRGPVTVWLPAGTTLRVGDWVTVQTSVHPAR